jgi:flagellar M-ring protein FliF
MDLAMDVASGMDELRIRKPDIHFLDALRAGFGIGRPVVGTMTTTLLLAYSGGYMALLMVFIWANRPEYALLYSNLDAADTSKIIEHLKANSIPYQLRDGGSTVFVKKDFVYELRIKFAGENLISSGAVGYELFDKNNLGLTDFMQRINLKRALEGELSSTINQIESIVQSRVHLVTPERALFEEHQPKSTASVVLKLKPHTELDRKQISGIANLVAASVEGLHSENVIIVDTYGRVLTKNEERDVEIGMSSSQYELKKNVEKYLSDKAQSMLDKVLGQNNSIVRISAELNFEKINRTSEKIDPDNTAILSEERNEETSTNRDTTLYKRENTITNYELNKVVEHYEGSVGDVKHLAIAVFVNGVYKNEEEPNVARSDEEIQKITQIVKNAVGFNESRNDQIEVEQLAFDRSLLDRENEIMASIEERQNTMIYLKIGLAIIGAVIILFALRAVMKKFGIDEYLKHQKELLLKEAQASLESLTEKKEDEAEKQKMLDEKARKKQEFQEKIARDVKHFTTHDKDRAARILRYWLVEDED